MEEVLMENKNKEQASNAPETSPQAGRTSKLPDDYLIRVYENCKIPPRICVLSLSELETESRAKPLWENVTERAQTWKNGYSEKRGVLYAGSQGSGKSTALFFSARAAVKSYVYANPPKDFTGIINPPIFIREFPEWLRFEFAPQGDSNKWNFHLLDEITNSRSIFFDDLTLDPSSEAFKPVREFLFLLTNRLSNMVKPTALYISTNNTGAEWDSLLGSQLVERIIGKKTGLCETIKCNWKSFRND